MTRWHHGRLVLIGDAAHATGPVWAQGVAMALEDAIVLGGLLACTPTDGWASVGAEFERLRRPTVEHVQAATDRMSRLAAMPGTLRDLVLAGARASQLSAGLRPAARPLTSCQRALTRSSHSRPAQAFPRERLGPETGMHRIPQSRERSITDAASRTISATFSAGVRTTTSRAEMLIGRADMLIGRISDRGGAAGGPTRGRRFRPTPRGRRRPGHRRARRPLDPVAPRPLGRDLHWCRPTRAALSTGRATTRRRPRPRGSRATTWQPRAGRSRRGPTPALYLHGEDPCGMRQDSGRRPAISAEGCDVRLRFGLYAILRIASVQSGGPRVQHVGRRGRAATNGHTPHPARMCAPEPEADPRPLDHHQRGRRPAR